MSARLRRSDALGVRWGWLLDEAAGHVRPGVDPWLLHLLSLAARRIPTDLPQGPAIYGAVGYGEWQYAGQTLQTVARRMKGHATDSDRARRYLKAASWHAVAAIPLLADTPPGVINRLERAAQELLRPRMGTRWPRP